MKFFFGYLAVGVCMTIWLYRNGYFEESVRALREEGFDKETNFFEDIILLSLCISGLFLWPIFIPDVIFEWSQKP